MGDKGGDLEMSALDVIRRRAIPSQLERPTAPIRSDGYATPGTPTVIPIDAYAQPLSPKELRNLPPGQDGSDQRNIWSESELKIGDHITTGGLRLLIRAREYWAEGPFYRAQGVITLDTLS